MATNYDAILEEEKKKLEESKQKQIDAVNKTHDSQASTVKTQYDKAVNDTKIGYESDYERNAVQKLINEKAIAEKNANLGLTDSGLNRTQQTAVQLSYANQKGDIDLARQNALDTLSGNLATTLSNIEQSRIGNIANIESSFDAQAQSNAVSRYNSTISSGSRGYAGGGSGNNSDDITLWYYTGTYDEDGNPVFRNSEGKTQSFGEGVNPYTGTVNKDINNGVFRNGYQPNNIGGKKLYAQEEYEAYVNGNKQKVWSYDDGKTLWAWDGSINEYVDVTSRKDELEK